MELVLLIFILMLDWWLLLLRKISTRKICRQYEYKQKQIFHLELFENMGK